jgi:hypothetical protein
MAKQKKRTNPVILLPGMIIGANAAEMDDEFLLKCFVQYARKTLLHCPKGLS